MPPSWRSVHYVQRPAKNIERKMIAESVARLDRLYPIEDFRYVGLGSVYFADFSMFHRLWASREMINIERVGDPTTRERFEFNRPYSCIELRWGDTNQVLPGLSWETPNIVWLDYDKPLTRDQISDLNYLSATVTAPSVVIFSVQVEPEQPGARMRELRNGAGEIPLPIWVRGEASLGNWKTAEAVYEIYQTAMATAIRDRNGGLDAGQKIIARQFLRFHYSDGAKMLTVGWILHTQAQATAVADCKLDELDFTVGADEKPYLIEVPNLTLRETAEIDRHLPVGVFPGNLPVPSKELTAYMRLYRHFPSYVDAVL